MKCIKFGARGAKAHALNGIRFNLVMQMQRWVGVNDRPAVMGREVVSS